MLKPAFLFADQINEKFKEFIFTAEFKYLFFGDGTRSYQIDVHSSDDESIQLASVDSANNVIGFFEIFVDRNLYKVEALTAICFSPSVLFSIDFHRFIKSLTTTYGFNKVNFEAVVGSPGELVYDKHLSKYNARIVGIKKNEVRLCDGKLYDLKLYEICPLTSDGI